MSDHAPVELSGRKKNALHKVVAQPALSPDFAATGPARPHRRVFIANFDGTNNDHLDVPSGERETLVASSFKGIPSGPKLESRYYHGVGTRADKLTSFVEYTSGMGCEDRAERAYSDMVDTVAQWRRDDPDVEVHVHTCGFSRGSATGLHFMNLVHDRGVVGRGALLAPGSIPQSAVLLDTVSTGQQMFLKLGLPPSAVSVLHLTAGGEVRQFFPLKSLADAGRPTELAQAYGVRMPGSESEVPADGAEMLPITYKRLHQVMLDGARHSDVGGSYPDGGIREVSAYLMQAFQASLGLPVIPAKPSFAEVQACFAHDSRMWTDKYLRAERPYRNGTRRVVHAGEVTDWDGTVVETVTVESKLKSGRQESREIRYLAQPDAGEQGFAMAQLGQEFKLTARLADSAKGEKGRMVFESTPPGAFGRQSTSRRFMFFGRPLTNVPTVDAIIGRLEAGEKAFAVKVRVEKAVPVFGAAGPVAPLVAAPRPGLVLDDDEWLPEIRFAIIRLNGAAKGIPQKEVRALMMKCLDAAAASILEADKSAAVAFRVESLGARGNRVRVAVKHSPQHEASALADWALGRQVEGIQKSLDCLTTLVETHGMDACEGCTKSYGGAARSDAEHAENEACAEFIRESAAAPWGAEQDDESLWNKMKDASASSLAPTLGRSLLGGLFHRRVAAQIGDAALAEPGGRRRLDTRMRK
jgi:hypothetical protein